MGLLEETSAGRGRRRAARGDSAPLSCVVLPVLLVSAIPSVALLAAWPVGPGEERQDCQTPTETANEAATHSFLVLQCLPLKLLKH
jgi:hypothetical protein